MKRPGRIHVLFVLICAAGFWLAGGAVTQESCRAEDELTAFFSNGQAVYDQQDPVKSQQNALRDFLGQAVLQAVGVFLSPSQMGTHYAVLRDQIVKQPERFVDTYQVYSENAENGLYHVTGQVTVSMDLLHKELVDSGISRASEPSQQGTVSRRTAEPSVAPAAKPVASAEGSTQPEAQPTITRGITPTVREILWAVSEKWDQEWFLPEDLRDPRGVFAASVSQELQASRYSLHLPDPGSLKMDNKGSISASQASTQAKNLGIRNAVVGSVIYRQERGQPARLDADLQILEASSGKVLGKLHKERDMEDLSNQDGSADLAEEVVREIQGMLNLAPDVSSSPVPGVPAASEGEWTVRIKMSDHHSYWRDVEQMIRDQAKGVQVRGLEIGADENIIRLGGVDGRSILSLNGKTLPGGAVIKIDNYSEENRSLSMSFAPSGAPQPGAKQ